MKLKESKYCMFTVWSYVDESHLVNTRILSQLNKKWHDYSKSHEEDANSMLVKAVRVFKIDSVEAI